MSLRNGYFLREIGKNLEPGKGAETLFDAGVVLCRSKLARTVLLKVWCPDLRGQHYLGAGQKCNSLGSTESDQLNQTD